MSDLNINKLSDQGDQYVNVLQCVCGHSRQVYPKSLAGFAGWEATTEDIVRRLRCSKCGQRGKCKATPIREVAPRGYRSH